jgi:magnesium-transporting ATPase (P-type)
VAAIPVLHRRAIGRRIPGVPVACQSVSDKLFALVLQFVVALIQLVGVAVASAGFDEVADASPFGRPGTAVACVVIAVVALGGVVVAWRPAAGTARIITAISVFVAVGISAVIALYLVVAGGPTSIFAMLPFLAAIMVGLIGWAVLQPPSRSQR